MNRTSHYRRQESLDRLHHPHLSGERRDVTPPLQGVDREYEQRADALAKLRMLAIGSATGNYYIDAAGRTIVTLNPASESPVQVTSPEPSGYPTTDPRIQDLEEAYIALYQIHSGEGNG